MATVEQTALRYGRVDAIKGVHVSGWAIDLCMNQPASLVLLADGHPLGVFTCDEVRSDVIAHGASGVQLGFRFDLPESLFDGRAHRLAIRFRTGEMLPFYNEAGEAGAEVSFNYLLTEVTGRVDGIIGSAVRGWAFRTHNRTGAKTGGVTLEIWANGAKLGQVKADHIRRDVADAHGCEPHCGFLYMVPPRFRDGKAFVLEFHVAPEGGQIERSPVSGSILVEDSIDQLYSMLAQVEGICTQVFSLKDQLKILLIRDEYTLDNYHEWATKYFETLRARMATERRGPRYVELLGCSNVKVSIICPTHKPGLTDFIHAVESVRHQTWQNWELIIVDDDSRSIALTKIINEFTAIDSRIRSITLRANIGISGATNEAITSATGHWIALFDHDDVLVDVAIEVMLLAAYNNSAKMIYSDEDKIDAFANYSEPHFKTDWNYRLLLTNNYVCHLLMVDAATLRGIGPLASKYDGAQDHDLVLRLSEALPTTQIHHVPEILYHWRKTANSTAAQTSAKPYAVQAGISAVRDHLHRRNLSAEVTAPLQSTIYDVRWQFEGEPAVTIFVPFKDQSSTTKHCIEYLLSVTRYSNYKVVLIDNWSTESATLEWMATLVSEQRVRIMRVEEHFNFSRLNNLAVQHVESELLLFMNNDIFVDQPDWLRLMVDEVIADATVGAVGAKLVYPNQTVQHGGVVLGVGGVADHSFRGEERNATGYMGRAISAQDVSVVTAACMLCRTDVFRKVGGFDEARLAVAYNDVDLCLKIGRAGYRIVFAPSVVIEHHESLSRGSDLAIHNLARFYDEQQIMTDRWGSLIRSDPYYNPHFSRESGIFEMLSNDSLEVARAPSLLHQPPPREILVDFPKLTIPARPAIETMSAKRRGNRRITRASERQLPNGPLNKAEAF